MFEHYLSNKNESATIAQNPKFMKLNTRLASRAPRAPSASGAGARSPPSPSQYPTLRVGPATALAAPSTVQAGYASGARGQGYRYGEPYPTAPVVTVDPEGGHASAVPASLGWYARNELAFDQPSGAAHVHAPAIGGAVWRQVLAGGLAFWRVFLS